MIMSNLLHVAISCAIVLVYTLIGNFLVSALGLKKFTRPLKDCQSGDLQQLGAAGDVDRDLDLAVEDLQISQGSERSAPSHDALHLLRLSHAFCPPGTEPSSIFNRDTCKPDHGTRARPGTDLSAKDSYSEGELNLQDADGETFADVPEESPFCFLNSLENQHSRRILIKPPAFVHLASVAEIEPGGDHKSTSTERRSSTTFAPDGQIHEHGTSSALENGNGSRKKLTSFRNDSTISADHHRAHACAQARVPAEPISPVMSPSAEQKRRRLFAVRPSISALRRCNQPKAQVAHDDQPKAAIRIDYMNTVRTRFKLISSKRITLKQAPPKNLAPRTTASLSQLDDGGHRMSSIFYGN